MKLILAETHYWESAPRVDSHHLARHLARRGHEILYLSAPISPFHFLQRQNWRHKWRRLMRYGGSGREVAERLRAIVPFSWLPAQIQGSASAGAALERSLRATTPSLPALIRRLGFSTPDALMIQSLYYAQLPEILPGVPVIYRMTDDFEHFPGMPHALLRAEAPLARRAKVVTVPAITLQERARAMGAPRVELLAHGVDAEMFRPPDECLRAAAPRKVVYAGAIDAWFHAEMVAQAAQKLPDVQFDLAGPPSPHANLDPLRALPNVRLLGPKPYESLPALFHGAAVGIIPFRRSPLIDVVRPLKMLEYLAAGLAVVSTRWPELEQMGAPATLIVTPEQFAQAVAQSLENRRPMESIAFAEKYSWAECARQVEQLVNR